MDVRDPAEREREKMGKEREIQSGERRETEMGVNTETQGERERGERERGQRSSKQLHRGPDQTGVWVTSQQQPHKLGLQIC